VFVSPTSVALALAMTYNGAAGDTKTAMETALHKQGFTTDEINQSYKSLIESLVSIDPKVLLQIANSIWYRQGFNVLPQFLTVNQNFYDAEVSELDFSSPAALGAINGWVDEKTNHKIEKIIEEIPGDVVMYLINAVYFKGIWKYAFDKKNTFDGPFFTTDDSQVTVPFMQQEAEVAYYQGENFSMVDLPYGRGNFSMTILLPNAGGEVDDITASLNTDNWTTWLTQGYVRKVKLVVPRFTFSYKNILNDELSAMGMGIAFTPQADFSGINGVGNLNISKVIHKTFVDVNEEGTEAAAVTAVEIEFTSMPADPPVFHVDRPFVFAIRETTTGAILFIGLVKNPLTTENE
jgi:serpin B